MQIGQRIAEKEGSVAARRRSWRTRLLRFGRDGTVDIVAGSVVAGLAGLAYEVIGGRAYGTEGFAPVSALLTLHFLVFVVVLIPLEQVTIRRLALDANRPGVPVGAVSVVLATAAGAGVVAFVLRGRLFDDNAAFTMLVVASVLAHGFFALARGYLAGKRRFRSYGLASGAAAVLRLAVAGFVVVLSAGAAWFGLALAVGPLAVLGWRSFSGPRTQVAMGRTGVIDTTAAEGHYVAGLMLASAASQAMLLAGPVIAALLGAPAATVSIVFVTFSVARAPLSLVHNLVARIVPPLTRMADRGEDDRLARLARRTGLAALGPGVGGYAVAAPLGPPFIGLMFGQLFRPSPVATGLVGSGVMVAVGALVVGQVFVARGDTHRLATAWLGAILAGGLALVVPISDPATRVAASFVVGEVAAMALLVGQAARAPSEQRRVSSRGRDGYRTTKRLIDIVVASVLLIAAAPVIAGVATVVLLRSGRPVLFGQIRIGQHGRSFRLWKFRTMEVDGDADVLGNHLDDLRRAPADGSVSLQIPNDPRITPIGRFLRRWSLDELPNLWNVLAGDLSLVGPRPLLAEEIAVIASEIGRDAVMKRAEVPQGITGLAQVEGRDDIGLVERSLLDERYVAERSTSLDLWILVRTVVSVVRYRGA